jgi:hypothetical protein
MKDIQLGRHLFNASDVSNDFGDNSLFSIECKSKSNYERQLKRSLIKCQLKDIDSGYYIITFVQLDLLRHGIKSSLLSFLKYTNYIFSGLLSSILLSNLIQLDSSVVRMTSNVTVKNILFLALIIFGLLMVMISSQIGVLKYMLQLTHILDVLFGYTLAFQIV